MTTRRQCGKKWAGPCQRGGSHVCARPAEHQARARGACMCRCGNVPAELCHACGSASCPAAGDATVDKCPSWQAAEARRGRGEYLPTRGGHHFELEGQLRLW